MTCATKFYQRVQAASETTRVEPEEVAGRPTCIWKGCGRHLRGDGSCVMGHPQAYEFRDAAMQALPLEFAALTCALGELVTQEPTMRDDPRVQLVEDWQAALWSRQESPGEGPVQVGEALDAAALYLLVHPLDKIELSNQQGHIRHLLYVGHGQDVVAVSNARDTYTASASSVLWLVLRERLGIAEDEALPVALTARVMDQALTLFTETPARDFWRDDARLRVVRDYVQTAQRRYQEGTAADPEFPPEPVAATSLWPAQSPEGAEVSSRTKEQAAEAAVLPPPQVGDGHTERGAREFYADKSPVTRARAAAVLARQMNYNDPNIQGVMTRQAFVERAAALGYAASQSDIYNPRSKKTTKMWFIGDTEATRIEVDYLHYLQGAQGQG